MSSDLGLLPKIIVVAVDGSEPSFKAVTYAVKLAHLAGSKVTLLHVILLPAYASPKTLEVVRGDLFAKAASVIARATKLVESSGVQADERIVETDRSVVLAITEQAQKEKAGLIVVGTRGTSGLPKLMLGSVAAGVVSFADCPVLALR